MNKAKKVDNIDFLRKKYINSFLDRYMGWNFGAYINGNDILKQKLLNLNNKVIDLGLREYFGYTSTILGSTNNEYIQHFMLPINEEQTKTMKKNIWKK